MREFFTMVTAMLGVVACSQRGVSETSDDGETATDTTATDTTDTGDGSGDDDTESSTVFTDPEEPPSVGCDPFEQDCAEGEKCVPWASTGGNWDSTLCVSVTGEGAAGDPCIYESTFRPNDDCDEHTHCWNLQTIDDVLHGICVPLCTGSVNDPQCPEGSNCLVTNDNSIALCMEGCDPASQDCDETTACYWAEGIFGCLAYYETFASGDPCTSLNSCEPGSYCAYPNSPQNDDSPFELVPGCIDIACCVSFCSVDDPQACPDPQLECVPFFDPNQGPAGYEHVGVCILP